MADPVSAAAGGDLTFEVTCAGETSRRQVRGPVVTIGRDPSSTIAFPREMTISRNHAEIHVRGSECVITERNTLNATYVNGVRLSGSRPLAVGDTVSLGQAGPQLRLVHAHASRQPGAEAHEPAKQRPAAAESHDAQGPAVPARERLVAVNPPRAAVVPASMAAGALRAPAPKHSSAGTTIINRLNAQLEGFARRHHTLTRLFGVVAATVLLVGGVGGAWFWHRMAVIQAEVEEAQPTDWVGIGERLQSGLAFIFVKEKDQATTGSGFLIDDSGLVATNYHVIEDALEVKVQFADGETFYASPGYVFASQPLDLAVIKVDLGNGPKRRTFPLSRAKVRPLQEVAVFGAPQGLRNVLTLGTVQKIAMLSAIRSDLGSSLYPGEGDKEVIVHGADSAPGNSGSPLVDAHGEVVGVHSMGENAKVVVSGGQGVVRGRRFAMAVAIRHLIDNLPAAGAAVTPHGGGRSR